MHRSKNFVLTLAIMAVSIPASYAQAAGGNQQIFQDEQQMMQINSGQANQLQHQERQYESQVQSHDAAEQPYRLYVEERIQALRKIKRAHGSPALSMANENQLYALQQWLSKDSQTREQEQAHIKQLDLAIANLQQQRQATYSDLGNDINSMRENQQAIADDDRFNKMMRMNMFNELQSEMGAASWGRPPEDGTYNSTGGYGLQGGYGYSFGGGRRGMMP